MIKKQYADKKKCEQAILNRRIRVELQIQLLREVIDASQTYERQVVNGAFTRFIQKRLPDVQCKTNGTVHLFSVTLRRQFWAYDDEITVWPTGTLTDPSLVDGIQSVREAFERRLKDLEQEIVILDNLYRDLDAVLNMYNEARQTIDDIKNMAGHHVITARGNMNELLNLEFQR
jgi:exonuclease VII small subunit